jgi:hypothetical protein
MTGWARTVAAARRVPAPVVDSCLAAGFLAAMLAERVSTVHTRLSVAVALSAVIAVGLGLRRRAPVTGFLVG